ncbi:hypothetical protein [Bathymodiolus japonicus methanotrophic gill symbiont]|uniref:hypothetical protein n=1 Tax=Bathymodiolus japonicus methanotrophic gill symbiont TaxID=113269 RepID=UPI001C8D6689|nr:hypothetical protein [Bathymodiolus japonicus methanotrophic gill symbiont]
MLSTTLGRLMNNFINIPKEKDTYIIDQKEITIKGIPALKQHWRWDGIIVDSLIFNSSEFV